MSYLHYAEGWIGTEVSKRPIPLFGAAWQRLLAADACGAQGSIHISPTLSPSVSLTGSFKNSELTSGLAVITT
jgi:hypothetical protein